MNAAVVAAQTAAASPPLARYVTDHWFDIISGLSAFCALFVSIWTFRRSTASALHAWKKADVASQYSQFTEFNRLRLEFPKQSHLMEVPSHYQKISDAIKQICADLSSAERLELQVQERGVALLIFSMYEKLLFDLELSRQHEQTGGEFTEAVLTYLRHQWLRNPRLLYLWSAEGGSLCSLFEEATCQDYKREIASHVRKDQIDALGPFTNGIRHAASA
jgi:hypothetical protein